MEALRVEGLTKDFGGIRAAQVDSLIVQEGEHLAIIGPNGAGKTTFFNLLGGQLTPTSGKVFFFGKDITKMSVDQRAHLGIARSFQATTLFQNLTVMKNLLMSLQGMQRSRYNIYRSSDKYEPLNMVAKEILESIDLWEKRDEQVRAISYGEQRKLEMALSLASSPKLLLLDEPSTGLTATESADITSRIRSLAKDITVILVAHDMDLVFGVAERIVVLHYGQIIADDLPEKIAADERVHEIYMGEEKT